MAERLSPTRILPDAIGARIGEGDCLRLMTRLPAESVDAVITDPPYGISYRPRRTMGKPNHPWRRMLGDNGFDPAFQASWLTQAYRLLKPDTHIYVFCADYQLGAVRSLVAEAGFHLKRTLVWEKNMWTMGDCRGDYGHQTELIVFAHKGRRELTRPRIGNVLHFPKVPARRMQHPTEKPVELIRLLIRKSVPDGGLILDPFAGSGTTGVAATLEQRRSLLLEADPQHIATMRRRIAQLNNDTEDFACAA